MVKRPTRFCSAPCRVAVVTAAQRRPLAERFWEKVDKRSENECWPWTAGCFGDGYGAFNINGTPKRAPRVSYELTYGAIPDDLDIRHTCDNPICVNPSHLIPGTAAENIADMIARGRKKVLKKLTDAQVREIRRSTKTFAELQKIYGVSSGLIGLIRGKSGYRLKATITQSRRKELAQAGIVRPRQR